MREGSIVDATLIAAPYSTKNDSGERDPEMHQTKKCVLNAGRSAVTAQSGGSCPIEDTDLRKIAGRRAKKQAPQ